MCAETDIALPPIVRDPHNAGLRKQTRVAANRSDDQAVATLIGSSPGMQQIYRLVQRVSRHNYPILILGESGTGKELVARSIHAAASRTNQPFVPIDCSALVPTLIESELFGHIKGAFTGAADSRPGLLLAAKEGTLFLDEIGELPLHLQPKLLRVIQEREVRPIGSTLRLPISARIIAATNCDLHERVRCGKFRSDLYYRLNVVQIHLPPLRERKSDIPLLANYFLEEFVKPNGNEPCMISEGAMAQLRAYHWPGNVRELQNFIQRAVALGSGGPTLDVADLPDLLPTWARDAGHPEIELAPLRDLESWAILRAIRETAGDKIAAAKLLGIGKTTLYRRLKMRSEPSGNRPVAVTSARVGSEDGLTRGQGQVNRDSAKSRVRSLLSDACAE